jgi:hypothetical protein
MEEIGVPRENHRPAALPQTPFKRFATMKSYLSSRKSPRVKKLQKKRIIPSPEDRKDAEMNAGIKPIMSPLHSVKISGDV